MAGASLTLVKLDDELNALFDAPAEVAVRIFWRPSLGRNPSIHLDHWVNVGLAERRGAWRSCSRGRPQLRLPALAAASIRSRSDAPAQPSRRRRAPGAVDARLVATQAVVEDRGGTAGHGHHPFPRLGPRVRVDELHRIGLDAQMATKVVRARVRR